MGLGWGVRRGAVLTTLVVGLLAGIAVPTWAQGTAEADALSEQADEFYQQGKYAEATELAKRVLTLREEALPPGHPDIAESLNNLAFLYSAQGRLREAEPLYQRALALYEVALPAGHPDVGTSLNNLAELYRAQGRTAEAEQLYRRSLALREKALGPDHPDVGQSLNNLANLFYDQGRTGEAEPLYKRALALREAALPAGDPGIALSLNNLAFLYSAQGRLREAEPLYERALALREAALPAAHPDLALSLNNLALLYYAQGRYADAEPLSKRGLAMIEKALGPDHPRVGTALNNLAAIYDSQKRDAEAEPLYKRALTLREAALPAAHPDIASSLNNLAALYYAQGRYAEAEPLFKRTLAMREAALPADHPHVAQSLNNLAAHFFEQREWARAADYWRRGTGIIVRRTQRGTDDVGQVVTGKRKGEAEQLASHFWGLVKAAHRLASEGRSDHASLAREIFLTAQWTRGSEAAGSLAQMAARGAKGDVALASLVRERQDLVEEWQKRDAVHSAAVAQDPGKRDRAAEAANAARLADIDARIGEIDKRLAAEFPDYAALARPAPLSVEEVQAQLGADEALVLFLDTSAAFPPEETFVWIVTRTHLRWVRSDLGTPALAREVAALRCGLDAELWDDKAASARCRDLLKAEPQRDRDDNVRTATLPFDLARAHAMYKTLFGQVEDLIRDKHLLIVPSGPLTQLPFQVLVTDEVRPAGSDPGYRAVAWLAKRHALTVLPAVSSLKALRGVGRIGPTGPAIQKAMLGIGNPLLDGTPSDAKWAALARSKQACKGLVVDAGHKTREAARVTRRGGRVELAELQALPPLPDTADELCAVAAGLKLAPDDILLGARASEATLKAMSADGRLARYRVLHFATHGIVAGEISSASEPGLVLTPPKGQSELDDGYLSASEVAALKLNAEWVILSACNTAAGDAEGADALSGLARAFIYAGARALLVSHWSVDSAATVKLITSAIGAISRDANVGRADALRRAMLAMIGGDDPRESHPAFWAPFIVVGEGAAR